MKVPTLTVLALPLLVLAHGDDYLQARRHHARQAPSSATPSAAPSATPSSTPSSTSGTVPSSTVNGSVIATSASTPTFTLSPLLSTNPTAIPLASITANEPSLATLPLSTTQVAGSVPTYMSGAPPLPDVSNWNASLYPALDKVPIIDAQVQQWITEVANTGIVIPDIASTNPGGCPNNTAAASDLTRCWWTCGGCTRPSDVTSCPTPLTWGLTYDDGPSFYTTELLQYLTQNNLKSTFFVVGSRMSQFPSIAQTEYMSGNQMAVHTWSHPSLTTLNNSQVIAELGWSKKVIKDVLGVTPNFMRPPYGDIDDRVRAISIAMGLTPVMWTRISATATFDTSDWNVPGNVTTSVQVLQNWEYILGNVTTLKTGFIVLEHDLWEQTVQIATGYILPDALAFKPNFNIMPVVQCLNMPISNAYIETNDNATNPPPIDRPGVTTIHTSATATAGPGSGSGSSATERFRIGFSLVFITTVVTLLAGVYAIRF